MTGRILVADDDADNRAIATEALALAGYEVAQAADGREALDRALRDKPDLVLLDLSMPKMDGWEVARRLRGSPEAEGTLILAYTAHALPGEDARAKAAGCDEYLAKPCAPRELVQKVTSLLKMKESLRGGRK